MKISMVACYGLVLGAIALEPACSVAPQVTETVSTEQADLITSSSTFYDGIGGGATQCTVGGTGMHCCPTGSAMVGAHVDQNVFKCATITAPRIGAPFLDTGTQRAGMHSCPLGSVMIGFRADMNRLACQQVSVIGLTEFVDNGTQDSFPMHVCSGTTTMTGIRLDRNQLNCADGAPCSVGARCAGGCSACLDGTCQCSRVTSCTNPPVCQTTNLCSGHGGVNPNLTCIKTP